MLSFSSLINVLVSNWEIIFFFFVIAILYASVGFGGGSSYLAILALTSLAFAQIRAIALLCNIVVVSGGTFIYVKKKLFNWKKIVPLVIISVPMAFVGGYLKINQHFFYILLGITLLVAAILMWLSKFIANFGLQSNFKNSVFREMLFGGIVGFVSGMVGIGGGIFLAPLLYLTNWDMPKKIAATSSFFILVNSIAGLGGQSMSPNFSINIELTILLMITVFFGGQIGSRLSVNVISAIKLKKTTALLIVFVALKLLWKHLQFSI